MRNWEEIIEIFPLLKNSGILWITIISEIYLTKVEFSLGVIGGMLVIRLACALTALLLTLRFIPYFQV